MAINLSDVIAEIESRYNNIDSSTSALEQFRINAARDRLNNSGVYAQTYKSTGHLPTITDSAYLGSIFQVEVDNVFGDSDGAFYMATARDSGWVRMTTLQDSDESQIEAPGGGSTGVARQGSTSGYAMGNVPYANNYVNKFSLTSDGNATDVLDLSLARGHVGGNAGPTHGYATGGQNPPDTARIDKFPFASDDNATDVGGLTAGRQYVGSSSGATHGYTSGGGPTESNVIDKFAFASDGDATDVGNLVQATKELANGMLNSLTDGYAAGGRTPTLLNTVGKFPFATDTDASAIPGTLTITKRDASAASSSTHGYTAGGQSGSQTNVIDKFAFSTDGDATDVGDLTVARMYLAGVSSTTHGYAAGGWNPPSSNVIDKYSFSSDGNATDVGDLNAAIYGPGGTQN